MIAAVGFGQAHAKGEALFKPKEVWFFETPMLTLFVQIKKFNYQTNRIEEIHTTEEAIEMCKKQDDNALKQLDGIGAAVLQHWPCEVQDLNNDGKDVSVKNRIYFVR